MSETTDEMLDRLTTIVAQAGGIGDDEAENIGAAPFLHARVRARIEAERKARAGQGSGWFATLLVATRAVAVLLLVTIGSALAFWFSPASPPIGSSGNTAEDNVSRVIAGGTCALSTTEECAISTEEVLATLFQEGGKKSK